VRNLFALILAVALSSVPARGREAVLGNPVKEPAVRLL
jgi:hypothetical protein